MKVQKEFQLKDNANRDVELPLYLTWFKATSSARARYTEWRTVDRAYRTFYEARKRTIGISSQYRAADDLRASLLKVYLKETGQEFDRLCTVSGNLVERLLDALDRYLDGTISYRKEVDWDRSCEARFNILWLLSDLKVTLNPLILAADALDGIGALLPVAQSSTVVVSHAILPHVAATITTGVGLASHTMRAADRLCHVNDNSQSWYERPYEKLKEIITSYCAELWKKIKSFLTFSDLTWKKVRGYMSTALDWVMRVTPAPYRASYGALKDGYAIGKAIYQRFQLHSHASSFEPAGQTPFFLDAVRRAQWETIKSKGLSMLTAVTSALSAASGVVLSVLAAALAKALLWLYRMITRVVESRRIDQFLNNAVALFKLEPVECDDDGRGGRSIRPLKTGSGLARDPRRFDAFFADGCRASPLIPLLLMNTPVCKSTASSFTLRDGWEQPYFDRAIACFDSVRPFASKFLLNSGFRFATRSRNAATQEMINLALKRPVIESAAKRPEIESTAPLREEGGGLRWSENLWSVLR